MPSRKQSVFSVHSRLLPKWSTCSPERPAQLARQREGCAEGHEAPVPQAAPSSTAAGLAGSQHRNSGGGEKGGQASPSFAPEIRVSLGHRNSLRLR